MPIVQGKTEAKGSAWEELRSSLGEALGPCCSSAPTPSPAASFVRRVGLALQVP